MEMIIVPAPKVDFTCHRILQKYYDQYHAESGLEEDDENFVPTNPYVLFRAGAKELFDSFAGDTNDIILWELHRLISESIAKRQEELRRLGNMETDRRLQVPLNYD